MFWHKSVADTFRNNSAPTLVPPDQSTRTLLVSIYLGCGVASAGLALAGLDRIGPTVARPGELACDDQRPLEAWREIVSNVAATFRLMINPRMAMLIPTLFYLGVDTAFSAGHFTKVGRATITFNDRSISTFGRLRIQ